MVRAHVLVCGGTGCTSSRSAEILEELNLQIKEHGLEGEVQTVKTYINGRLEKFDELVRR